MSFSHYINSGKLALISSNPHYADVLDRIAPIDHLEESLDFMLDRLLSSFANNNIEKIFFIGKEIKKLENNTYSMTSEELDYVQALKRQLEKLE